MHVCGGQKAEEGKVEQLEHYEEKWNWRLRVERSSLLYVASPVTCGHGEVLELLLLLGPCLSLHLWSGTVSVINIITTEHEDVAG